MARRKRFTASKSVAVGPKISSKSSPKGPMTLRKLWKVLTQPRGKSNGQMKPQDLTYILSNMSTLVSNGVPLPKAIATLAKEDTLSKYRDVLDGLRQKVESGMPFSTAIDQADIVDSLTVNQVRLGERSGTLPDTLRKLSSNRNKTAELRKDVIRKISYPALLVRGRKLPDHISVAFCDPRLPRNLRRCGGGVAFCHAIPH